MLRTHPASVGFFYIYFMIRIAIQNKGRLAEESLLYLAQKGLSLERNKGELIIQDDRFGIEILYVRDDDIPHLVESGAADFGIVGENVLRELGSLLPIESKLGFGSCNLVIAVPESSGIISVQDIAGKKIATSYPRILQEYLKKNNIYATMIQLAGSVEIAPSLGLSEAICDLTKSGQTLKQNRLRVIENIFCSEAVLIKSPVSKQIFPSTPLCKL